MRPSKNPKGFAPYAPIRQTFGVADVPGEGTLRDLRPVDEEARGGAVVRRGEVLPLADGGRSAESRSLAEPAFIVGVAARDTVGPDHGTAECPEFQLPTTPTSPLQPALPDPRVQSELRLVDLPERARSKREPTPSKFSADPNFPVAPHGAHDGSRMPVAGRVACDGPGAVVEPVGRDGAVARGLLRDRDGDRR